MNRAVYSTLILSCLLGGCIAGPGYIKEMNQRQENLENNVTKMSRDLNDVQRRLEIQETRIRNLEQNYSEIYMKIDELKKQQITKPAKDNQGIKSITTGDLYARANNLYNQGQYLNAILAYQIFIDTYPNDTKVADAYLKQGLSLVKIGRTKGARFFFKTLIDRFPDSNEADIARRELEKIDKGR
jgi:TolA-binding protein